MKKLKTQIHEQWPHQKQTKEFNFDLNSTGDTLHFLIK